MKSLRLVIIIGLATSAIFACAQGRVDARSSVPRLIDGGPLRSVDKIATPEVNVLLGYTRRPLHLPDDRRMALFSFSYSALANWIFLVNAEDMSFKRYLMPENHNASHCAALGSDGDLYFMPYATGMAHRFDPESESFESFESPLPKEDYTWDAFGATNGSIYFGTWPTATFGEYNTKTCVWSIWPQVVPNTAYVTQFSEVESGRIRFKAWGPEEVWMEFDPATRSFARVDQSALIPGATGLTLAPQADDEPVVASADVNGRHFAVTNPSGALVELDSDGTRTRIGDTGQPSQPVWWLKAVGSRLTGVSYYGGMFNYDLESGELRRGQLDNRAASGNSIMFIESVSPTCVIGANYSQQNLFRLNPTTGELNASETVIARSTGEPMCAIGLNGKGYIGVYTQALLCVYDPAKPFSFPANPIEIADLSKSYRQTRPRAAVTDGERVYFSVDGEYNVLGGALAIVEPDTNAVEVFHQLIPDQNLPTLAYDSQNNLFWGGTDRWGQMHSHPPTQLSALIYAFNPATKSVVRHLTPWEGADLVNVLAVASDGTVVASMGLEIALVDGKTGEVFYKGPSPVGVPSRLVRGHDGDLYGLFRNVLHRWDFPENTLTALGAAPDCLYLTEPSPGTWVLASPQHVFRIDLTGRTEF